MSLLPGRSSGKSTEPMACSLATRCRRQALVMACSWLGARALVITPTPSARCGWPQSRPRRRPPARRPAPPLGPRRADRGAAATGARCGWRRWCRWRLGPLPALGRARSGGAASRRRAGRGGAGATSRAGGAGGRGPAAREQVVVALVDALGLAVEVGVEVAGVAGEDAAEGLEVGAEVGADRGAAAAGAARRDSEPLRTGCSPDRYGDIYSGTQL
jgi:hypothetical protein